MLGKTVSIATPADVWTYSSRRLTPSALVSYVNLMTTPQLVPSGFVFIAFSNNNASLLLECWDGAAWQITFMSTASAGIIGVVESDGVNVRLRHTANDAARVYLVRV